MLLLHPYLWCLLHLFLFIPSQFQQSSNNGSSDYVGKVLNFSMLLFYAMLDEQMEKTNTEKINKSFNSIPLLMFYLLININTSPHIPFVDHHSPRNFFTNLMLWDPQMNYYHQLEERADQDRDQ